MAFFTYAQYKKCFDWAYDRGDVVNCTKFVDLDGKLLVTGDGENLCVQPE